MTEVKYRYSAINTAHFCLTKYYKQYVLGEKAPGLGNSNFEFGTAIHAAIESYFDGGDATDTFNMYWKTIKPEEYTWDRYKYDELGEIGLELMRKWLKGHAKNYEPIHIEKQIEFMIHGFKVTGKPDAICMYKGKLSLVDWKTSASTFDKRKGLVDSQTWIYVAGAKQVYDLDIEQVVYAPFIKYGATVQTPICIPVTKTKLHDMLYNASTVMRDLRDRKEWPRNEQNCLRCEFFSSCYPEETK